MRMGDDLPGTLRVIVVTWEENRPPQPLTPRQVWEHSEPYVGSLPPTQPPGVDRSLERTQVRALTALPGGGVLAAVSGPAGFECFRTARHEGWEAGPGIVGLQVVATEGSWLLNGATDTWTTTETPATGRFSGAFAVTDLTTISTWHRSPTPGYANSAPHAFLFRPTRELRRSTNMTGALITDSGDRSNSVSLPEHDPLYHVLNVRHAPHLLSVTGPGHDGELTLNTLTPDGRSAPVFSIEAPHVALPWWYPAAGVWVNDASGPGIVHGVNGILGNPHLLQRRDYPSGRLRWETVMPDAIIDADRTATDVVVALRNGVIVRLNAATGDEIERLDLRDDHPNAEPLSICVSDRLYVGTRVGRIIGIRGDRRPSLADEPEGQR